MADGNAASPIDSVPGITSARPLGEGGFGEVFFAREEQLNRDVAVKLLHLRPDDSSLRSFDREMAVLGRLSQHPNIVTLHRAGVAPGGYPYLVMEHASGGSLADVLRAKGSYPWRRAFEIGIAMCDALSVAHDAGVRHRDVKPANIFLSAYGVPVLGDFGISRLADSTATQSKTITGSLPYASPEQVSGTALDGRTDIYSLGSTLYALIAGHPAFLGPDHSTDIVALIGRIATAHVPPLPSVPPSVHAVISRAMAKSADDRYSNAAQFRAALQGVLDVGHVSPQPASDDTMRVEQPTTQPQPQPQPQPRGPAPSPPPPPWATTAPERVAPVEPARVSPPSGSIGPAGSDTSQRNRLLAAIAALVCIGAVVAFVLATRDSGESAADPVVEEPTEVPDDSPADTGDTGDTEASSTAPTATSEPTATPEPVVARVSRAEASADAAITVGARTVDNGGRVLADLERWHAAQGRVITPEVRADACWFATTGGEAVPAAFCGPVGERPNGEFLFDRIPVQFSDLGNGSHDAVSLVDLARFDRELGSVLTLISAVEVWDPGPTTPQDEARAAEAAAASVRVGSFTLENGGQVLADLEDWHVEQGRIINPALRIDRCWFAETDGNAVPAIFCGPVAEADSGGLVFDRIPIQYDNLGGDRYDVVSLLNSARLDRELATGLILVSALDVWLPDS